MEPGVAGLLGVGDAPELAAVAEFAGIPNLTAHFGVAGAGVKDDRRLVLEADDFEHLGGCFELVVADERRRRARLDLGKFDDFLLLAARARARCSSISLWKTSTSTVRPRSRAMSS